MCDGQIIDKMLENGLWSIQILNCIDENVTFPEGTHSNSLKGVVIDLGAVSYINSIGIRSWVSWIGRVVKKTSGKKIEILRMPLSFIRASNLIEQVLPPAVKVKSFFANYFCPSCSAEKVVLFDCSPRANIRGEKCDNCGSHLELELSAELYDTILHRA